MESSGRRSCKHILVIDGPEGLIALKRAPPPFEAPRRSLRQPKMQEGWLWERRPGRLYGSDWRRRWCEVNGRQLRVYDANKAREVATIHIRAETTLCDRLTEDEVRRVGRAPQAGDAA